MEERKKLSRSLAGGSLVIGHFKYHDPHFRPLVVVRDLEWSYENLGEGKVNITAYPEGTAPIVMAAEQFVPWLQRYNYLTINYTKMQREYEQAQWKQRSQR